MLIDPIIEYDNIIQWLVQYINQETTPKKFAQDLGKFLNKRHRIKFDVTYSTVLDAGDFTVAALYDVWRDEQGKKPIMLSLFINHDIDHEWLITTSVTDKLALEIIEAVSHEYQHAYQYRTRNYVLAVPYRSSEQDDELRADQDYLGHKDEIDAYSVNIAVRFYLTKQRVSLDLENYRRTFGVDHWIVRRLLKKITKRLAYLENLDSCCTSTET